MNLEETKKWRGTIVKAVIISAAWNSLYVFSRLPGGSQHLKGIAQTGWGIFCVCALFMVPYLIFGSLGLIFHIGRVDGRRLARIGLSFEIVVVVTFISVMIGSQL